MSVSIQSADCECKCDHADLDAEWEQSRADENAIRYASQTLARCINLARQGKPTNAPTAPEYRVRVWSRRQLEEVRQMRAKGLTQGQIAIKLGRPINQIRGAYTRLAEMG